MRQALYDLVRQALERLRAEGVIPGDAALLFKIERPREKSFGDFSTNAAMIMARAARLAPRQLAERLVQALPPGQEVVERCEVAGPGFINFFVTQKRLRRVVSDILRQGEDYGRSNIGQGARVQIEFVSANPTGPMHVGHGRGAVTGDALATLLQTVGFSVEREYYVNDAGGQVRVLGQSVLLRYRELFGHEVTIPPGCYPGEYIIEVAQALRERDGERWLDASLNLEEVPAPVVDFAIEQIMVMIWDDLKLLGIEFDTRFSERTLHSGGGIERALAVLADKGLLYEGVLEPPKGKLMDDWEPNPQLLFRATSFGDDVDRPLKKSDGSFTYFAADIAYHFDKAQRGFRHLINVWGADHGGYVKRVEAAIEALTGLKDILDVRLVQMVNLTRGGKPVRMSKRSGEFVTLREVVQETGKDAVRFWFLTRTGTSQLDFDLELAVSRSNDNPVFYVQYAHARVCSVWRQVKEKDYPDQESDMMEASLEALTEEGALDLIRLLDLYPEIVESAALQREPHRIPYYLLDLAAAFHAFYNQNRILDAEPTVRQARLALITAVRQVLANGLTVIGVEPAVIM